MRKVFKSCFLTAKDIGVEKYSVNEIANKMKAVEIVHDDHSLYEFAHSITNLLEIDTKKSKEEPNKGIQVTPSSTVF